MTRFRCLAVAATIVCSFAAPPAANADSKLPDLTMAPLSELSIQQANGQTRLRFTAIVNNIGIGPFELHGTRTNTTDDLTVIQRVYDTNGTSVDHPLQNPRMYWSGDGHNHMHVRDLEATELTRLDNGVKVGTGSKRGFCFYDYESFNLNLVGAPQSKYYTTCGTNPYALTQRMGLSVGWADRYAYYLVDQWVDITGLGPGNYRLTTIADSQNYYIESNDFNNTTWVDIALKRKGAPRILRYGP